MTKVLVETWTVLYEGSLYILLGFVIAGLLREYLPRDAISRHLGEERPRSVVLAALLGAPIPLCSCGVLPAAAALRRGGASRASVLSFTISTPETGVDSIALSYGLLGPVMAVVRPLVAIATALTAGLISLARPQSDAEAGAEAAAFEALAAKADEEASFAADEDACAAPSRSRLRGAFDYGFGTLLDEIAFWLVVGIALTGVLAALLPDDFFGSVLGWDRGLVPMLAMVAAGVPLYLCASASTPVAAALIAKGLSPGAALVFLLVGPATNAATIAVVGRILGRRSLGIYLGSIVGVSLAAGLLLDATAADAVRSSVQSLGLRADNPLLWFVKAGSALVFVVLCLASFRRTHFREGRADLVDQSRQLAAALREFRWQSLLRPRVLLLALALALLVAAPASLLLVAPGQRGIVQRFGRVVESDLAPGLHLHLPPPLGRGVAVDVAWVRRVPVGFADDEARPWAPRDDLSFYLTADENVLDLRSVLHYRVRDPVTFALGLEQSDALMKSLARRELLRIVSATPIDRLYTGERRKAELDALDALRARLGELDLGLEVLDLRLLDVHAPRAVHDAFRDVASALEEREREIHVANGYATERRLAAEGEAAAIVETARAEAMRARVLARANSEAFARIAAVHGGDASVTETRLRLEAFERSLAKPHKFIQGTGPRGGDLDLWIGGSAPTPSVPGAAAASAGERKTR